MTGPVGRGALPVVRNYRGRPVRVWLGTAFVGGLLLWCVAATLVARAANPDGAGRTVRVVWWTLAGVALVYAGGLYDDRRPERTRGLLAQLRALRAGRVTSGIVKLVVIVLAAALTAWMLELRGSRLLLAIPLVAGSANLWNLLDVVPGRALKAFLPAEAATVWAAWGTGYGALGVGAIAVAGAIVGADLSERGMLGDGGANPLGFCVGVGVSLAAPLPWLAVLLAVVLALHVLAETVTLSRVIEAIPPLRWVDQLGRRAPGGASPLSPGPSR